MVGDNIAVEFAATPASGSLSSNFDVTTSVVLSRGGTVVPASEFDSLSEGEYTGTATVTVTFSAATPGGPAEDDNQDEDLTGLAIGDITLTATQVAP